MPNLSHAIPHGYVFEVSALELTKQVTVFEIEHVIKFANPNKAPGPDGFNAHFFKVFWPTIGNDVCAGIIDFFKHGYMLNQFKATFIMLVLRVKMRSL